MIYSDDGHRIAAGLGQLLRSRHLSIATAESCTGGGIAFAITSVAGSSDYFEGSIVAYSNAVKLRVLGVSPATLQTVGAVSEQCAREMADGVRSTIGADVGISSTGIAGPGGATRRKPVGLVYIAVATPDIIVAKELMLSGDRAAIMRDAAMEAIRLAHETVGAAAPKMETVLGDDKRND
jgi:nicotinamide-nucleotide amidase